MPGPRIGSLFTGTGMLDLAVMDVYGGDVVWHSQYEPPDKNGREDKNQYAAQILKRHWPAVPNLGDITKVCWQCVLDLYGQVDILTGGFPCTDVSSAGARAGLTADSRSGLWTHMAHAIRVLRPRLVVIENVEGLLSAKADRGLGPDGQALDEDPGARGLLRALGAVLGDLATLGFDAEWVRVAASEVGAAHPRKRVFIRAWPAAADAADLGHQRGGSARGRGHGPAHSCVTAAYTAGAGREGSGVRGRSPVDREAATDADGRGLHEHGELPAGRDALRDDAAGCGAPSPANSDGGGLGPDQRDLRAGQPDVEGCAVPDAPGIGRGEGGAEPAGQQGRPDAPVSGGADFQWGDYEPAIRRWEAVLGRPAPRPTDALERLSPVFTEWLMGLPAGWVTDTPSLTRSAMLKALGNGVVRLQAATALRLLNERVAAELAAEPAV